MADYRGARIEYAIDSTAPRRQPLEAWEQEIAHFIMDTLPGAVVGVWVTDDAVNGDYWTFGPDMDNHHDMTYSEKLRAGERADIALMYAIDARYPDIMKTV